MDFTSFINLIDSHKIFLVEINKAEEIEDYTWTIYGAGPVYWTTYTNGFPNKITEDDVQYTELFSISDVSSTPESFYYDLSLQRLYVNTVNSDDPGSMTGSLYDYKIIAYSWTYICNDNPEDTPIVFQREQEKLADGELDIWTTATNLTHWAEWTAGGTTSINREDTNPYSGGYCMRIDVDATPNSGWVYQDIQLPPSTRCKIKFWYKHESGGDSLLNIRDTGGNVYLGASGNWGGPTDIPLTTQTSWTKYELEFYTHSNYTNYRIALGSDAASKSAYFDKASFTLYREPNYYKPYLQTASMPTLTQGVSDYHIGSMEISMGRLDFINDGWWYTAVQDYLWHRKDFIARYGTIGMDLSDFGVAFVGLTKEPVVSDTVASMSITDTKVLMYKQIPATKYWVSNYPNLVDGVEGAPIPIIYGEWANIIPTEIDTTTFKYKISIHALESIDAVYKDGEVLTITTDYTVDLANGEFTLVADPEDALITCDVKGRKCDMEDGTYTENVADILFDILVTYVGVDKEDIDYASFLDLKSGRTQSHMLYLDVAETAMEPVRTLMASALFHIIPLPNGKLGAFRYVTGVDADTPRIIEEEHIGFNINYQTSGVYSRVKVRYNRNPGDSDYESIIRTNDNVWRKYGIDETFLLTSSLRIKAEAENIGDFYSDLLKDPMRKVEDNLPVKLFGIRPAEKIILNKDREDRDGANIAVLSEAPYRVLRTEKNFSTGRVGVEAWEDLQSAGETYCEVCYDCQTCYSAEGGSCSVCYDCQKCDTGQCTSCQLCYYCEKCNTGECSSCESCDWCQSCVSCQATQCASCVTCQTCNTCQSSECDSCQVCDNCQKCDTCQKAECDSCQVCVACEKCNTGECTSCQLCNDCQQCYSCEDCYGGEV